jgi:hypothetical protein
MVAATLAKDTDFRIEKTALINGFLAGAVNDGFITPSVYLSGSKLWYIIYLLFKNDI